MSGMTNDPQRSMTANLALSKLVRNQAMIDRALRPSFRDPMESFRSIVARAAVPSSNSLIDGVTKASVARTAGLAPLASQRHRTVLESFAEQQAQRPALAALGTVGNHAALLTSPRRRLMESFVAQTTVAPGIAALTKVQTGGLAAQLAGRKVAPGIAALTKVQTGGLAAQLAGRKVAPGIAALTKVRMGGLAGEMAKQNSVTSAIEGMRRATEGYAATTRALEPSRRPGYGLAEAVKAFDAESRAVEIYNREAIKPLPAVRNYTADLVRLQHEAADQRERERREEVDHRRQSLAVQVAMRDALIASEEARATDAEASASREMAALDRAIAAEARAEASDGREATMLRLTVVSVAIGGVSLLVAIAAVIVTIMIAS